MRSAIPGPVSFQGSLAVWEDKYINYCWLANKQHLHQTQQQLHTHNTYSKDNGKLDNRV